MPIYCKKCKIQGHDEKCYVLHPELYPKESKEDVEIPKADDKARKGSEGNDQNRKESQFK